LQANINNKGDGKGRGGKGRDRNGKRLRNSDGSDKEGGKSKGRGNSGMDGKNKTHSNGEPLCYNFNLRGCPNAKPGEKCGRGWHVCAEPGCGKNHSMRKHT